ncbi:MAG: hypothetical protein RMH75_01235 [Archaeoglobaceae archaeon]|nr:hypothetical protein [Archaeoglobaceae archaeon]MDW7989283.1 hypothetical protein [Archaeoglobaceae archaeon]
MIVKLILYGLKCKSCISAVIKTLEENGAIVREIGLKEAEIELFNDDKKIEKIIDEIRELGYEAKIAEIQR